MTTNLPLQLCVSSVSFNNSNHPFLWKNHECNYWWKPAPRWMPAASLKSTLKRLQPRLRFFIIVFGYGRRKRLRRGAPAAPRPNKHTLPGRLGARRLDRAQLRGQRGLPAPKTRLKAPRLREPEALTRAVRTAADALRDGIPKPRNRPGIREVILTERAEEKAVRTCNHPVPDGEEQPPLTAPLFFVFFSGRC